jgi:glucokinase
MTNPILAFDAGGTKTAWAIISPEGEIIERGVFPTPKAREPFMAAVRDVIEGNQNQIDAVGIGIAGVVSADHRTTLVCPNVPGLNYLDLADFVEGATGKPCGIDNDGRCALLGEAWKGAAKDLSSAVMITLGTGIGGAVMQQHKVLPHPTDITLEISHLIADQHDPFPAPSGTGSIEALIGGKNLEERYGVSLKEMAEAARAGKEEAIEFWGFVEEAFHRCVMAIFNTYGCKTIIVGGLGSKDLDLYSGNRVTPCPVIAAELGGDAGLYGAAQIALQVSEEANKDWDEE